MSRYFSSEYDSISIESVKRYYENLKVENKPATFLIL